MSFPPPPGPPPPPDAGMPIPPPPGVSGEDRRRSIAPWIIGGLFVVAVAVGAAVVVFIGGEETPAGDAQASPTIASDPLGSGDTSAGPAGELDPPLANDAEVVDPLNLPSILDVYDFDALEAQYGPIEFPADVSPFDGTPDEEAAASLASEMEAGGLNQDGIRVWVWPATSAFDGYLVLEVDESALALEGSDDAEEIVPIILGSEALQAAGVGVMQVVYHGSDDAGPYSVTVRTDIDAIRTAWQAGTELPPEAVSFVATRE